MNESNVVELKAPAEDALGDLLKEGARQLLAQAIEAEVAELLIQYADQTVNGKRAVVRNGYLPERSIQTGLGEVPVKVPKVRDRSDGGIKFNSKLVPPYLKRTKNVEEFIPWLYLKGISTGEMQPALEALLGEGATGLSAATVSRLKKSWEADYRQWSQRDLSRRRYVYVWADGVYSNRCPPWRAKRRRVVPGSREATRDTRRAEGAKGDPKGASECGVQSYGRPVCSRNELAMLWRNAG